VTFIKPIAAEAFWPSPSLCTTNRTNKCLGFCQAFTLAGRKHTIVIRLYHKKKRGAHKNLLEKNLEEARIVPRTDVSQSLFFKPILFELKK
jgi:hypothetical protein